MAGPGALDRGVAPRLVVALVAAFAGTGTVALLGALCTGVVQVLLRGGSWET